MTGRLDEVRAADGTLTHKMCCICFKMESVENLWSDDSGQKWDICSVRCAREAGM